MTQAEEYQKQEMVWARDAIEADGSIQDNYRIDYMRRHIFVRLFPFMYGIYPYTVVTDKQREAMEKAGTNFVYMSVYEMIYTGTKRLLAGDQDNLNFRRSSPGTAIVCDGSSHAKRRTVSYSPPPSSTPHRYQVTMAAGKTLPIPAEAYNRSKAELDRRISDTSNQPEER